MFTGIIEQTGKIVESRPQPCGRRLRVHVGPMASECRLGASVAINGVCLTVAAADDATLEFDVVQETLRKTVLGDKKMADLVNIERSLRIGDRLDGHFVQGHVDGVAVVKSVRDTGVEYVLWLEPDAHVARYIIPKGSITIDGVSLTIAQVRDTEFSVALIPTTLRVTTLGALQAGDRVNIETDMLVRAVVHKLGDISAPLVTQTWPEADLV